LESDISVQLAQGEISKVFISEMEGIWFTPVTKTKYGQIIALPQTSKSNVDFVHHTNTILSSPPKKRPYASGRSGNVTQPEQHHQQPVTYAAAVSTPDIQSQHGQNHHQSTIPTQEATQALQTHKENTIELSNEINHRYLEDTTTSTDNKVDAILNKLESWDIPTKRRGVTNNEERSASYPSLHHHSGAQEP